MEQYIPKSALVAEMDRQIELLKPFLGACAGQIVAEVNAKLSVLEGLKIFLNSFEVKEVDLEKEYKDFVEKDPVYNQLVIGIVGKAIAKYFFELGLRSTITEEDCKLIWNIGDEIPNMPEEAFFKELLKRYKAKKGEEV